MVYEDNRLLSAINGLGKLRTIRHLYEKKFQSLYKLLLKVIVYIKYAYEKNTNIIPAPKRNSTCFYSHE